MAEHAAQFIGGRWVEGEGARFESIDPSRGAAVWSGRAASREQVDAAVKAARAAFEPWADLSVEQRFEYLHAFRARLEANRDALAEAISMEVGKPRWESLTEVAAMIGKIDLSAQAYRERCAAGRFDAPGPGPGTGGANAVLTWRPHGVTAVFGPFNFPGHIPNGHIVPALLAGNTVVFKPSELTPWVAERTVELWHEAGLPAGVLNLVQGGRDTGAAIVDHRGLDGIYFTGSARVGLMMRRALADRPQVIVALEMGGNNPLIVHRTADLDAAAYTTIQSAYLTAGQRCTCASRLIVPTGGEGDRFIERLAAMIGTIRVGPPWLDPQPFMGPVITAGAADKLLAAVDALVRRGAKALAPLRRLDHGPAFLSPALLDVTPVAEREDEELFGPVLQLIRVADFDAAIDEANRTKYGLSAGLLCDERALFERFFRRIRAGVVSWNRQTTGASSRLPFGGVGLSGNHRPSGYFAVDYCSWPVASIQGVDLKMPDKPLPGVAGGGP